MQISIIHPSRGRPQKAIETYLKWVSRSTVPVQWILSIDEDDSKLNEYKELFKCEIVINNNSNLIDAVHKAIPNIKGDLVIVVSDDFDCPDNWNEKLNDVSGEIAIYINDGYSFGKRLMTLPILSKALIDRLGYIYYPSYTGMFADNDLFEVCDRLGVLVTKDVRFQHEHYTNGRASMDDTYRRHNNKESWVHGESLLKKRRLANFGLDGVKLSILIATIDERRQQFEKVLSMFNDMKAHYGDAVEIVVLSDNREKSIGLKRQQLLEMAKGEWIVFFDDDDIPYPNYLNHIMNAISQPNIDCVGINGVMTTNGKHTQKWCHRLGFQILEGQPAKSRGFDYLRPIIHFNPVKRDKALLAGFKDLKFGEDMDYAERLNKILTKEFYIKEPLFHYRYTRKIYG